MATLSFRQDFGLIVVGALIFTASFLWRDLFSDYRDKYFPKSEGITQRLFFTMIVTVLLVLIAGNLRRFFGLQQDNKVTAIQTQVESGFDDNERDQLPDTEI